MTLKSIVCFAAMVALSVSTAAAQTFSIDHRRDGTPNNFAVLDDNGDWIWEVTLTNGSLDSAANVVFEVEATGSDLIDPSTPNTNAVIDLTGVAIGDGTDGANPIIESATVGLPTFPWVPLGSGLGGAFASGLELDVTQGTNGQAFYAFGTGEFDPSASLVVATFTTDGPSTTGSLTSGLSLTNGEVGQDVAGTPTIVSGLTASDTVTVLAGDANLDGSKDFTDFGILSSGFFSSGVIWSDGDFNGDGTKDFTDFGILSSGFFSTTTAPATAAPEPGMLTLAGIAMAAFAGRRRR